MDQANETFARLVEETRAKFLLVRDAIDQTRYPNAYRMVYTTPLKNFVERTVDEMVAILIAEHEIGIE